MSEHEESRPAPSPPPPWRPAIILGVVSFFLYRFTSPAGITWEHSGEDGPEFAAVGKVFGVAHPTGYPLFTLLMRIASLGAAENAGRVQLLCNAAAAAAVAAIFLFFWRVITAMRLPATPGALVGAALFGLAPIWWQQATIIEVYPLHLFFLAAMLGLALAPDGWPRRLVALAYLSGLALTHHLQVVLIAPTLVIWTFAALGRARPWPWKAFVLAVAAFLAPITLYLVLKVRAAHHPALNWGDPESWKQLLWVIRGEQYRFRMFHQPLGTVADRARGALFETLPDQFAWTPLLLGLIGVVALRLRGGGALFWGLVVFFVTQLVWFAGYNIPDPDAYTLPLTLVTCTFLAAGAAALWHWPRGDRRIARGLLVLLLIGPAVRLPGLGPRVSLRRDTRADRYAREAMARLPKGALVVTEGDGRSFSLWYGQQITGRADVTLVYRSLLIWPWYHENLGRRDDSLQLDPPGRPVKEAGRDLIARALLERPTYVAQVDVDLARDFSVAPEGPLFRVLAGRRPFRRPEPPVTAETIDLGPGANACYRLDPFTPGAVDSAGLFRSLGPARLDWGGVPFVVAPPRKAAGQWSVIATAGLDGTVARLPLLPEPTSLVVLLADARCESSSTALGQVRVVYSDSSADSVPVISFINVWDHRTEALEVPVPEDLLVWRGSFNQSLAALPVTVDTGRTPAWLEIRAHRQPGRASPTAGFTVFAATQVLKSLPLPRGIR